MVAALLLIFLVGWLLQKDKPVKVDAAPKQETLVVDALIEVAPVQQIPEDVPEMTPEMIEEEMYWDSLELLAICIEAEAGNQGLEGKRLVADVILNRVDDHSGAWADTIQGVIAQNGQFSSYWDGGMDQVDEPSEETYRAVRMETAERGYPGIYYFREGDWPEYGTRWKKVGDHYFSGK